MPKFNPAVVIEDINAKPLRFGAIEDVQARKEMTRLRSEIVKMSKDAPEKVPELEEEFQALLVEFQPPLTLGLAVVTALCTPLPGEDDVSAATKIDHMEWATQIRSAERNLELIEFSNEIMDKIKQRVNRAFPRPEIIWRFNQALERAKAND